MNNVVVEALSFESLTGRVQDESEASSPGDFRRQDLSLIGHLDVRLTAVLGHAELTVDELFKLRQGSVLQLDESLDDTVTLMLNGKAIATAHLVAVGENFGVKISEIL
jgi:flagellar motor switch protein FliN/FliY